MDSEKIEDNEVGSTEFLLSDGKRMLRVKAEQSCWSISRWSDSVDKTTEKVKGWEPFKWCMDLGSVASKVFDFRLKNSDAKTLEELSNASVRIRQEIRKEFRL